MRSCLTCGAVYDDEVGFCPEDGTALGAVEDDLLGTMVGQYQLIERLGAGSMGSVWIGEHPTIKSRVAVKFLHRKLSNDQSTVGRFVNEARAANLIGHDNIVKVHDLGQTPEGLHYIVMELLEGESLESRIKKRKRLPMEEAGPIAFQICNGLHAAHENGIVHRDLKPANIFLARTHGRADFVKLLDFGVAKLAPSLGSAVRTKAGAMLGSPWYMAPELAMGEAADRRSDLYSLGVILFEMATGQVPFPEKDLSGALVAHLQRDPPKPRSLVKEIPEAYERVILHALGKDRGQRYQTAAELRDEVKRCIGAIPELPPPPEPPREPLLKRPGGQRGARGEPEVQARRPTFSSASTQLEPSKQQKEQLPTVFLPSAPSTKGPLLLGVLGGVAVVGIIIALLLSSRRVRITPVPPPGSEQKQVKLPEPQVAPSLAVRSTPPGASVHAKWATGEGNGVTPFSLPVPRGSRVHLDFTLAGYDPVPLDVTIEQAGIADVQLQPKKQAVKAPRRRRPTAPGAGDGQGSNTASGDDVQVEEFGDELFHDEPTK